MKSYAPYLLVVLLIGFAGCDYLGYDESTTYSQEELFSDYGRTNQFLVNIYSKQPTMLSGLGNVGGALRVAGSDIAEAEWERASTQDYNDGTWSATRLVDDQWGNMYDGIRDANRLLQQAKGRTFEDQKFNENYEERINAYRRFPYEARFLRAYFYFHLLKRYGGDIPLVTSVLSPKEVNKVEPTSYDKIVDFIISECDDIAPNLPVDYANTFFQETGRATKGAAMMLKERTLLYAASELHNPSHDAEKWVAAAEAAKAIIDSSWYTLEPNYGDIANNYKSDELIWGRREGNSNGMEQANFPPSFDGRIQRRATWPTQNLVNAYDMQTTGENIDAPNSGYDPEHPYENRDPRLYETVITNTSVWKEDTVQIWEGGTSGPPVQGATETGYYLKKNVIEGIRITPGNQTQQKHVGIAFRYGGLLLDYAEAMFEAYGAHDAAGMGMSALEAVNMVRERAEMPPLPASLSGDEFRKELREERMVELAFENERFWDIRRWMIGPSTTDIYGMDITRVSEGNFNYEKFLLEERVWEERMYFYPIPPGEIFKNSAFEQNPGW